MADKVKLSQIINQNRGLFWDIARDSLDQLDAEVVTEKILNYGNEKSVRQLFDILGTDKVAKIFYDHINRPRQNYLPETIHYFNLYFKRHAPQYSHPKTKATAAAH